MAVTITYGKRRQWPGYTIQEGHIVMDSSYPTGGEDVSAQSWDDNNVIDVVIDPLASNATYKLWYDNATNVVYANTRADGAEVANTTDLSAVSVPFWMFKKK